MTQRIALTARLSERFERRVQLSTHWLRLRPSPHARGVEAYSLKVDAEPHFLNWLRDPYENHLARLDLPEPVFSLGLELEIIASLERSNPFDFLTEPYAANYPFEYPAQLRKELAPYLRIDRPGPWLSDWLGGLDRSPKYIIEKLGDILATVHGRIASVEPGQPGWINVESLLQRGSGSSWEAAWLLTLSLRGLGLAARFTSGYHAWLSAVPEVADTVSAHAWSEVFVPGAGWVGLDPANGLFTGEGHIPLAAAPEPLRTVPLSGYHEACDSEVTRTVAIRRLTALPGASALDAVSWGQVSALGGRVGSDLAASGIKLTVGTGLSFVSSEHPGASEWTTAALGSHKRQVAELLIPAIAAHCGVGGVMQIAQGEWYSGEELPRWRLGCFMRADGRPIWKNPELLGWRRSRPMSIQSEDVRLFADTLARALGISPGFIMPAHEDGLHQLWAGGLGSGLIPSPDDLRDPERRSAVAACLSTRHGDPAGYVLPLRWDRVREGWSSGRWTFRRPGLFLIPGKSPLGFRLPIDSLPAGDTGPLDAEYERCQTEVRALLSEGCGELSARFSTVSPADRAMDDADGPSPIGHRPPRTALALELRDGQLYVFIPPLTHLEHYLDLVAAVEATALETGIPVLFEGYEPPEDHRLRRLAVEPEPGVLKVWLPDMPVWQEQARLVAAAYAEAEQLGLSAERIIADGRRVPPGGGAELVLGGESPGESPFLNRPELLGALIVYWQRHPSLSYLFAGRLVGPDGPAPRADEGRDDALYELSLALDRIPRGEGVRPWVPDRLLRHLLADPGGNMKRAEIRTDLLYSPDRPSLRLGKVVLRSFESVPDPRFAALQSLLVVALSSMLARRTDVGRLIDWGEALHDRFMLPRLLWGDFLAVLGELGEAGYPLQAAWFEPIVELRFPILGTTQIGDVTLELRSAHEPWPLLAEETAGGGVTRFVDASNERVQVRCVGLTPGRYGVCCNGFNVPLHETGVQGEYVAGVRYKVWNPPSTLHPTVFPVNSLVVDLVDLWTGRNVGGFTYYPPRPGVWGASAAAWPSAPLEVLPRKAQRRLQAVNVPPWSVGGKFLPFGSATELPPTPVERARPDAPYLLDLTHIA